MEHSGNRHTFAFKLTVGLFLTAVMVNLSGIAFCWGTVTSVAKSFLMPLLCILGLFFVKGRKTRWLYVAALALHTVGDVCLIFSGYGLFIYGMAAFFLGHVCYLWLFASFWQATSAKARLLLFIVLPIWIMAGVLVVRNVMTISEHLLLPVTLYTAILMAMIGVTFFATLLFRKSWWLLLAGSVLFTVSDTLIAVDMFMDVDFPYRGVLLMGLYITAQVLLTVGIIKGRTFPSRNV